MNDLENSVNNFTPENISQAELDTCVEKLSTILLSSSFLYSFSAFFISNLEDSVLFLLCLLFNLQFNHGFLDTPTLLFSSLIYKKFTELFNTVVVF
jgi:hypothetical protein